MSRKKIKKISMKTVALILITILYLIISIGYSYLKQSLNIFGKSTMIPQKLSEYEKGNSTYIWSIDRNWQQGGTTYVMYNIKLSIVNMDKDIDQWVISFDIPNSFSEERTNVWGASLTTYKNGRLTLVSQNWNGYVAKGSTLDLDFQLAFNDNKDFYIENLTLNGLLATNE